MKKPYAITLLLVFLLTACNFPVVTEISHKITPSHAAATPTSTATPTADDGSLSHYPSKAKFQVFILNPVRTCLAGNDFASGNVCFGEKCGDCQCAWEDFDPPAPMTGISPEHIDDPEYAGYAHRVCLDITLTPQEVKAIEDDMRLVAAKVYEWSEGALELQMSFTELPVDYAGFVAPDFVFGPFEVDDELLNPYVGVDTDFVYVVTGGIRPPAGHQPRLRLRGSYGK